MVYLRFNWFGRGCIAAVFVAACAVVLYWCYVILTTLWLSFFCYLDVLLVVWFMICLLLTL